MARKRTPYEREAKLWIDSQAEHVRQLRDEVRSRLREAASTLKIAEMIRLQLEAAIDGLAGAIRDRAGSKPARGRKSAGKSAAARG